MQGMTLMPRRMKRARLKSFHFSIYPGAIFDSPMLLLFYVHQLVDGPNRDGRLAKR